MAWIVGAINAAATMDVRTAGRARARPRAAHWALLRARAPRECSSCLEEWRDNGSSRLDVDLDGKIDAAGAAVMDTAWPRLADATIKPLVPGQLANQLST